MLPPDFDVDDFVRRTLAEDLGSGGDVTSSATIQADARFTAQMNARQGMVVAGLDVAAAFFRALDPGIDIEQPAADGDRVEHGTKLMRLAGNARAMLAAERSALNTLQHLSGIATLARRYADAIAGTGATLLDNMDPPMLREAVARVAGRAPLEASGVVTLETIRFLAETGVDYISVGRITQSAPAVDIGLDYSLD
jgi:nicotinate-nucleotide pyrophosphorylase